MLVFFIAVFTMAQTPDTSTLANELDFMVGTWEGEGWFTQQGAEPVQVTVKETVVAKAGGTALAIDGLGSNADGKVVHDAFGIICRNPDGTLRFLAFRDGHVADGLMTREADGSMVWGFKHQAGEVQYTIEFKEDVWHESGRFSPDGETWYPFFEMTLKRVLD